MVLEEGETEYLLEVDCAPQPSYNKILVLLVLSLSCYFDM